MTSFHNLIDIFVGLFLLLFSICLIIFPPKFGHEFYGIITKQTLKNETSWKMGQKRFALCLLLIGAIFLVIGNTSLRNTIPGYAKFCLLIVLWTISKYLVEKTLTLKNRQVNI
ncbi:MAG: SdpI family protein [Sphingobacteriales bacterium]|nr:MAG: SdpI family protein [Sphingobacteriales bacterium]